MQKKQPDGVMAEQFSINKICYFNIPTMNLPFNRNTFKMFKFILNEIYKIVNIFSQ